MMTSQLVYRFSISRSPYRLAAPVLVTEGCPDNCHRPRGERTELLSRTPGGWSSRSRCLPGSAPSAPWRQSLGLRPGGSLAPIGLWRLPAGSGGSPASIGLPWPRRLPSFHWALAGPWLPSGSGGPRGPRRPSAPLVLSLCPGLMLFPRVRVVCTQVSFFVMTPSHSGLKAPFPSA